MVWVTVTGLGVGLAGAWAIARVLESLLYGVTVHDTLTFVTVPLVLVVSAAFATLVPARRAMFVNPADVMRAD
jgi:putative ABC transport system permease protein